MADKETIAAILAAGMLAPVLPPATDTDGAIHQGEQTRFVMDVLHAVGVYRAVLEALSHEVKGRRVRLPVCERRRAGSSDRSAAHRPATADRPAPAEVYEP